MLPKIGSSLRDRSGSLHSRRAGMLSAAQKAAEFVEDSALAAWMESEWQRARRLVIAYARALGLVANSSRNRMQACI
jgi:hypothetical protein